LQDLLKIEEELSDTFRDSVSDRVAESFNSRGLREIMSHNWRSERVRLALTNSRARRERERAEAAAVILSARVKTINTFKAD
jgi:hypothetical protein